MVLILKRLRKKTANFYPFGIIKTIRFVRMAFFSIFSKKSRNIGETGRNHLIKGQNKLRRAVII